MNMPMLDFMMMNADFIQPRPQLVYFEDSAKASEFEELFPESGWNVATFIPDPDAREHQTPPHHARGRGVTNPIGGLIMKLVKTVPERKVSVEFSQVLKNFSEYGPEYRSARSSQGDPMDTCSWCGREFEEGESIALAIPTNGANKVLCDNCVEEIV